MINNKKDILSFATTLLAVAIAASLLLIAGCSAFFSSCGDNENFWGPHTLTDDEIAEMARQDSIKQAQRERIDADLILEYTVEFYLSANSYDGAEAYSKEI